MAYRIPTPQSAESLENISKRLEVCVADFRSVAEMMRGEGVKVINMINYLSFMRGLQDVENYANASKAALFGALEERGAFKASHESANGPASKPRKKSKAQ